jgi:deazaflavin-dependent oxidoreductase (nitroreductase family)
MTTNQKVEQEWETPSYEDIPNISKMHVQALESSDADAVWVQAGMHHVLLHTVGRKSGKVHKVALPTWNDANGNRIVVASYGGFPTDPSWFLNLSDRQANPEVRCRVQGGEFWSAQEILDGDDYTTTWEQLCEDRAWYRDYQAKTDRRIPLVRLPETRRI